MGELNRALENAAVLLVVILSAPLAALLLAVIATYLFLIFSPASAENPDTVWAFFGSGFAAVYLTICVCAMARK